MDINGLVNMVYALKSDDKNLREFQSGPVAFIEKFLGVDLPDDQINAIIAGISSNFLSKNESGGSGSLGLMLGGLLGGGEDVQANAVDSKGVDFSALIGKIASAKLDLNGDGKIDINDASSFLGDLLGGGANGEDKGLSLGSLLKTFKI
ncbi:hypothetical protein [uncultured Campylobacter sp.]|uniref:hypothetical protein n=1 Tax=uncultured Campylobacter sp. TaxID=218934 RepID=UPI00260610EA|nr:hypothetical protein [uncultured Campylobacter sp.]